MENKEELAKTIQELWLGSGYSMDSVRKFLKEAQTKGFEASYDESAGMAYFQGFKVFYSPYGFEVIS